MNRWLALVPIVVFAAFATALGLGLRRDPSSIPSVLIDQPAPTFALDAVRIGDQGFSNADLNGRVTLINVFGSWCSACRVEHPMLMEIAARGDVAIHGVDWKDDPARCRDYLAQSGDPYTRIGADLSGRLALDFGVTGAPETFVIDRTGRIRYKHVGPITPDVWRETLAPLIAQLQSGA